MPVGVRHEGAGLDEGELDVRAAVVVRQRRVVHQPLEVHDAVATVPAVQPPGPGVRVVARVPPRDRHRPRARAAVVDAHLVAVLEAVGAGGAGGGRRGARAAGVDGRLVAVLDAVGAGGDGQRHAVEGDDGLQQIVLDAAVVHLRIGRGMKLGGGFLAQGHGVGSFAFGGAYQPLTTAQSDPLWARTCFGCVNGAPG